MIFSKKTPEYPIQNEKAFVKYAVRDKITELTIEEKQLSELEEVIDRKIEETLSED